MLFFRVVRNVESHDYKYNDPNKNEYQNNTKNNMEDSLILYDIDEPNKHVVTLPGKTLWACHNVQTVSNHPKMKYSDTVAPGDFEIKCFVMQGGYNTEIHGIINAKDINGQEIDHFSMQNDGGQYIGRWLVHSSFYAPLGKDTKGYSGGCFIMSTKDILELNRVLKENGIKPGDIIKGELLEI